MASTGEPCLRRTRITEWVKGGKIKWLIGHHLYNPDFKFVVEPEDFNEYTGREMLQYRLGATMYIPGTEDFALRIISGLVPGLTAIVLCFEDACPVGQVEATEANVRRLLDTVADAADAGAPSPEKIPLIFVRIHNLAQFKHFGGALTKRQVRFLCSINLSKFNAKNEYGYYAYLKDLDERFGEILYSIPIIEDPEVAYKESRVQEPVGIKKILDKYHDLVLQVCVDGTDFSSVFGARRGMDYPVYDIMTVREYLANIVNICGHENDYVISGPVQEYFRAPKAVMFEGLPHHGLGGYLMKRLLVVNNEIDGLLREVILDRANGFVGRTAIHPTHVKFVSALMAVTKEEYGNARMILGHIQGGVVKGSGANKVNEVRPYTNWAKRVCNRARAFGVVESKRAYIRLFVVSES